MDEAFICKKCGARVVVRDTFLSALLLYVRLCLYCLVFGGE